MRTSRKVASGVVAAGGLAAAVGFAAPGSATNRSPGVSTPEDGQSMPATAGTGPSADRKAALMSACAGIPLGQCGATFDADPTMAGYKRLPDHMMSSGNGK